MEKHLYYYPNHTAFESSTSQKNIHNVIYCGNETHLHYDYSPDYSQEYFTLEAVEGGTFTFTPKNNNVVSYSLDNGVTWVTGNSVTVNAGESVIWKGTFQASSSGSGQFTSTASFKAKGNIMSLLYGDNFKGQTIILGTHALMSLFFKSSTLVNAEDLILPATTLTQSCYSGMFYNCTNLILPPKKLPAIVLVTGCYSSMFRGCSNLITAPEILATTLAENCCNHLFRDCVKLNYIKAMFITAPSDTYTGNWVDGVAASGTFVKNSAAQWNVTGINGIPTGWTVETASN